MTSADRNLGIGLCAMIAPVLFTGTYVTLSTLRPEYSHLHKAISELGSVGAPRAWVWNLFGFILPGLTVTLLGLGLANRFAHQSGAALPSWALVASGAFMAFSGVFQGDFENRRSATMFLHAVGSLGSFVLFLVAAFSLPRILRRFDRWRPLMWPSLALAVGSVATGFLRTGSAPGLGQRLGFACFFLWVALIGNALYRDPGWPERVA